MDRELVLYRVDGNLALVTLNRPEKLNALSRELWRQLDAVLRRADEDPGIRAVVLAGAGGAFCAGADLSGGEDPTGLLPWWEFFDVHRRRQFAIWDSKKLFIAAIHGHCLGRGLELALWCDIVLASEDAKLGQPEVREGWVLWSVVPWLIGPQRAKLFMLSGDVIDAREAERLGLVTRVVRAGTVQEEAVKLAQRLSHVPPVAARAVKQMINGVYEQLGLRAQQAGGGAVSALSSAMSPGEKGTEEIERVRREQGFKASIQARDAPFRP